jgi:hypothetical protein
MPCEYGQLLCMCVSTALYEDSPGRWLCTGPPEDMQCPATLPNLGDGCSTPGVECYYLWDGCTAAPGSTVFCYDGAWEEGRPLVCL